MTGETVVLLHGIAQPKLVMTPMALYFGHKGYATINIEYPSRIKTIDRLTADIHKQIFKNRGFKSAKLHFVTHSMGGLVLRSYLSRFKPENLGRTVMLAPPNRGSEVADALRDKWLFKYYFGPAGQELTTTIRAAYCNLPVDFDLGVIAGENHLTDIIKNYVIDGPHDGLVSVESTKIDGMRDHLVVPHAHATMLADKKVWDQALYFLDRGSFKKGRTYARQ